MDTNYDRLQENIIAVVEELNEMVPLYHQLKNKPTLTAEEKKQLQAIENFLIDISPKLEGIKSLINRELTGITLDYYYALKEMANKGDPEAKNALDQMSPGFKKSLSQSPFESWN